MCVQVLRVVRMIMHQLGQLERVTEPDSPHREVSTTTAAVPSVARTDWTQEDLGALCVVLRQRLDALRGDFLRAPQVS